jgi:hypothetical protein
VISINKLKYCYVSRNIGIKAFRLLEIEVGVHEIILAVCANNAIYVALRLPKMQLGDHIALL